MNSNSVCGYFLVSQSVTLLALKALTHHYQTAVINEQSSAVFRGAQWPREMEREKEREIDITIRPTIKFRLARKAGSQQQTYNSQGARGKRQDARGKRLEARDSNWATL